MNPTATWQTLDAALRGGLIACLLLLGALMWRMRPRAAASRLGTLLAAGLAAYVVNSWPGLWPHPRPAWGAPLMALGNGNAVVFWLFCRALFDDACEWHAGHALVWLGVVALAAFQCAVLGPVQAPEALWLGWLLDWLPLPFAVLALGEALATWRADLVERRRRLRRFIVAGGVAYTLVDLLGRQLSAGPAGGGLAGALDMAMLLGLVGTVVWRLQDLPRVDLFGVAAEPGASLAGGAVPLPEVAVGPSPPAAAPAAADLADPAEASLAAALQRAMAEDRLYREENLTIGGLAARLAVPEYRLRRLINQRLGQRNFNAFVNGWRLAEAKRALADPAQSQVPVLTIALDAGFQSIGPFNRAFKADTGLTPTEFRRQGALPGSLGLADS